MKNSRAWVLVVCLAGALCLASVALAETPENPGDVIEGEAVIETVEVTATITKIDKKTREITIKDDDGEEFSFIAGEEVKNFDQIKKGDVITATYVEALAYEVIKGDLGTAAEASVGAVAAEPGEKPGVAVAGQVTVVVTITEIDLEIPSVTFKGPEGNTRTIEVLHPEKLEGVEVGDTVALTYTEALALTVTTPEKK